MLPARLYPALFLVALLASALSACASAAEEPATPASPAPSAQASAPRAVTHAFVKPVPVLIFEDLEGAQATRARAAFASVPAALGECHPGAGGVIRLRLTAAGGKAQYSVEPSTSLDPRRRRCVLEALSTVDIEGISGDASPSARPSGFTAQFRLEW